MGDASAASDLAAAGWMPDAAIRLVPAGSEDAVLVADGARRWNVDQREAIDPYGPVLTEEETRTVVPPGAAPVPTAARLLGGVRGVRASSSAADLGGELRRAGADATAAVDANAFTSWRSRRGTLVGQWWEIELDGPTDLTLATAQLVESVFSDHRVTQVRVIADGGATEVDVPPGGLVSLAPAGVTQRLRIEATAVTGTVGRDDSFGIAEVAVPGVVVRDQLEVRGSPTSAWLLAARPGSYATCVPAHPSAEPDEAAAPSATSCDPGLQVEGPDSGPIQRVLPVERPTPITGTAWVRAASSATAGRLADRLGAPTISAVGSSVAAQDLVTRPQAAADGDPSTAWRPSPEDESPDLRLTWRRPTAVTGLRLVEAEGMVSSRITQIRVTPSEGGEPVVADVPEGGVVDVPRTLTGRLDIEVLRDSGLSSVDSVTGGLRHVPIALAEIEVVGGPAIRFDHDREERLPCGSGPDVTIAGEPVPTAVTASARGVVDSESLPAGLCSPPGLPAGDVDVEVEATFAWVPLGLALSPPDAASGPVDTAAGTTESSTPLPSGLVGAAATHHLAIGAGGVRTLALAVPTGTGWAAHAEGRALEPVVVDGWMQGWVLPSGTDRVTLTYSASVLLRAAVGVASLGWLTVLVVALVPGSFLSRTRGYLRRAQSMAGRSTQT
jgi:arabinofuranan 3-O-arabinosyltransferase